MKKNIFQITENISLESGGLRTMISLLDKNINATSAYCSKILTLKKEPSDLFQALKSQSNPWCYTTEFVSNLHKNVNKEDIVHSHGVWMHPQYAANKFSKKHHIKSVLTSHGMLQPYLLNDKGFKKKIYLDCVLKKILDTTSVLHAITDDEKNNLSKLTKNRNIEVIPNLINMNIESPAAYNAEEEYILYLGRFHRVKGLELLLKAFSQIKNKYIKLKLAGFSNQYFLDIMKMYQNENIIKRIEFVGEKNGMEKDLLYANAKVFVSPSYSEVIGMVNLEAAMQKTPVITTFNTGLDKNWSKNGGILINPAVEELTIALDDATSWDNIERIDRGSKLFNFVYQQYSWDKKGFLWQELYDNI